MNALHCAGRRRCAPLLLSLLIGAGALAAPARGQQRDKNVTPRSLKPASQAGEAAGDERIVVDTNLVSLTATVTDKNGRHVPGLGRTAFSITDEKVPTSFNSRAQLLLDKTGDGRAVGFRPSDFKNDGVRRRIG